jgi:2-polyprenyl-6-methoxyphenol hydroxylase-like FAD-dependent oxidoreductase
MAASVLICGAGVAGPTVAFWLIRNGMRPTIVERAPRPRAGGYMIDFWGAGYEVAERMGLIDSVRRVGYQVQELRLVNRCGRRVGGFNVGVLRELTADRYISLARSDLARILLGAVEQETELIFDDSVASIQEQEHGAEVEFRRSGRRRFDLVIGADGLHSEVRRAAFGPEDRFERRLGYTVAAFKATGYRPPQDENAYVAYTLPGRHVARFAMRDDRTLFLFVAASEHLPDTDSHDRAAQERALERAYGSAGWECRAILDAMHRSDDLYFDRVSQIVVPRWHRGRVVLLGDAAYCPSLLAGEGAGLAMAGAYVLAGELAKAHGDHTAAFERYEAFLRPVLERKQRAAARLGRAFAPRSWLGVHVRDWVSRACNLPVAGRWLLGKTLVDDIQLAEYAR